METLSIPRGAWLDNAPARRCLPREGIVKLSWIIAGASLLVSPALLAQESKPGDAPTSPAPAGLPTALESWLRAPAAEAQRQAALEAAPAGSLARAFAERLPGAFGQIDAAKLATEGVDPAAFVTAAQYVTEGKGLEAQAAFLGAALLYPEGSQARALARALARAVEDAEAAVASGGAFVPSADPERPRDAQENTTAGAFSAVFTGTGLGVAGGILLDANLQIENERALVAVPLLTGIAGGAAGYAYHRVIRKGELDYDSAAPIVVGPLLGLGEGALLTAMVAEFGDGAGFIAENPGDVIYLGALAGTGVGVALSQLTEANRGDSSTALTSALWGTGFSFFSLGIAGLDNIERVTPALAAGYNLGLAAGAVIGKKYNPSVRRVAAVNGSGLVGGLIGGLTTSLVFLNSENVDQAAFAGVMAGSIGGLALGYKLTGGLPKESPADKAPRVQLNSFGPTQAQGASLHDRPTAFTASFSF